MKKIFTLALIMSALYSTAQVNGYAKVTTILGPVLTVTASNETYDQFNIGDKVIVMQMQDNVLGSTANDNTFGNLSSIGKAGKYEVATVLLVARTGLLPTVITLAAPLQESYNTGANSSVQIITFPNLGNNYSTTADMRPVPWNGNIGGVLAFSVTNTLTLRHNIIADTAGFRGGIADVSSSPYGSCNSVDFYHSVDAFYGNKGEGIYKVTNANYAAGKGKLLNAGGGGNTINAGGGGGGNYTAGGDGYFGWSCSAAGTGGIGGIALGSHMSSGDRAFLGGGGGSGESNDNANNRGGNGGGIIIIQASTVRTTGSGTTLIISANGQNANNIANDGGGGGGAAGTILFLVNSWNITTNKKLNITANGGTGANVGHSDQHGGGGGGAQGAIIFSTPVPLTNITTAATNGLGGLVRTGSGAPRAASGQGVNNAGVIANAFNILPLKLVSFTAVKNNDHTQLEWKTQGEVNVSHFEIERSSNGTVFETIGNKQATGNSALTQTYSFTDPKSVAATTYYRLRMVDVDNKFTYSQVLVVRAGNSAGIDLNVFPNPATSTAAVFIKSDVTGQATIRIMNMQGAALFTQQNLVSKGENTVLLNRIAELSNGVYNVQVALNGVNHFTRLIVQK